MRKLFLLVLVSICYSSASLAACEQEREALSRCESSVPTCQIDADCAAGQECQSGQCRSSVPLCQFDTDCGAGQVCQSGLCQARPIVTCPRVTCIARCRSVNPDGSCFRYSDNDFCGVNPSCEARCRSRNPDGSCFRYYDEEFCQENRPIGC